LFSVYTCEYNSTRCAYFVFRQLARILASVTWRRATKSCPLTESNSPVCRTTKRGIASSLSPMDLSWWLLHVRLTSKRKWRMSNEQFRLNSFCRLIILSYMQMAVQRRGRESARAVYWRDNPSDVMLTIVSKYSNM